MFTVEQMLELVVSEDYTLTFEPLPNNLAGYHQAGHIHINDKLEQDSRLPFILAHELAHARRGDTDHQPETVERLCDEEAAWLIIDLEEYKSAECACESVGAIARFLDMPYRAIEAYQRALVKRGYGYSSSPSRSPIV